MGIKYVKCYHTNGYGNCIWSPTSASAIESTEQIDFCGHILEYLHQYKSIKAW